MVTVSPQMGTVYNGTPFFMNKFKSILFINYQNF